MSDRQESTGLRRTQPPANRSQQRALGVSRSSPLSPSGPPMPTSSAPPYTDGTPPLRRASTDSDSSVFSHFSLTMESEAGQRAWEQDMLGSAFSPTPTPTAIPSGNPSTGGAQSTRRWVVFKGRVPGIYRTAESARSQTDGIPNAIYLAYTNAAHAERDYKRFEADGAVPPFGSGPWVVYVGRATGVFDNLGDVKAAVDDYPNSQYVTCTTLSEASELYCLFRELSSKETQANGLDTSSTASTSSDSASDHAPNASEQRRRSRPFQPFSLDESIRSLSGHESWWVMWAAFRPGVYFGIDELLKAGPLPGGYRSVEDQDEAFEYFHLLLKSRLIRKLPAPPA